MVTLQAPGEGGTKRVCQWAGCGTGDRNRPEDSKNVGPSNRKAGINICSGGERTEREMWLKIRFQCCSRQG